MKLSAQCVLLIALIIALATTFGGSLDGPDESIPGTGPVTEPNPITLRACAKEVIVRAVVDDGLSLPEAAALCGEMYSLLPDPPGFPVSLDDRTAEQSSASAEERFCRQVIGWVESDGRAPGVVARLQSEFREWRQGDRRLPDSAKVFPSPDELLARAKMEWLAQCSGIRSRVTPADDSSFCE